MKYKRSNEPITYGENLSGNLHAKNYLNQLQSLKFRKTKKDEVQKSHD